MKHYHGTPLGGVREGVARFAVGRFLFIPWMRDEDLPPAMDMSCGFAVDNSAFTAWKNGEPIERWGEYYKWCRMLSRCPRFDFAIIPDVIDGDEHENDSLIKEWDKAMNYPTCVEGCPVWHMHESLERLERMVGRWRRVAIGSSGKWPTPGTKSWWQRMNEAMSVCCDSNGHPKTKLHGLRMLSRDIFSKIPLASADSTNVARNCDILSRFGMYKPPTRSQRACSIADGIESVNSPSIWVPLCTEIPMFDMQEGNDDA